MLIKICAKGILPHPFVLKIFARAGILEIIKKLLASHLENSSPLLLPRSWLGCVFVQSFGAAEFSGFSCPPDGFLGFDPDGSGTAAGSGTETHAGILAIIKK